MHLGRKALAEAFVNLEPPRAVVCVCVRGQWSSPRDAARRWRLVGWSLVVLVRGGATVMGKVYAII